MRARFFRIILVVLIVVTAGSVALHSLFLKQERIRLIDEQVRETATALLNSEFVDLKRAEFKRAEEIISEELGESRIGKFFVVRNDNGDVLFESTSAQVLALEAMAQEPQWVTMEDGDQYIRVLNLKLPRIPGRTLQVGLVIDKALLSPSYLSAPFLFFIGTTISLGLLVAWFLTSTLLKPIHSVAAFVEEAATNASSAKELPALPARLKRDLSIMRPEDEFHKLLAGLEFLIRKINKGYQLSRFWSYQMAHELKTPMAIVEAEIENAKRSGQIDEGVARSLRSEIIHVSETISSFLAWAEIENSKGQKRMFALRASKLLAEQEKRFSRSAPGRLKIEVREDFYILSNLQQAEQVLQNLIANALVYSPVESQVILTAEAQKIRVQDTGPGIPQGVLSRLGEPFNKGDSAAGSKEAKEQPGGHGLGLAFVHSVAKLNGWKLDFKVTSEGTTVEIEFPDALEEPAEAAGLSV